jgi:hypothetical protein
LKLLRGLGLCPKPHEGALPPRPPPGARAPWNPGKHPPRGGIFIVLIGGKLGVLLTAVCDRLEAQLTTEQTESLRLLEAVLHEALVPAA